jgi:hypothetical protein
MHLRGDAVKDPADDHRDREELEEAPEESAKAGAGREAVGHD